MKSLKLATSGTSGCLPASLGSVSESAVVNFLHSDIEINYDTVNAMQSESL